jgi:hypothetical protein
MADYLDAFPSRFLRADDIVKPYDCTIKDVDYDNVGTDEKPEKKLVAVFKEDGCKPIVLNKTRCEALEEITKTRDYHQWANVRIHVSKGWTRFAGNRKACTVISGPEIPF